MPIVNRTMTPNSSLWSPVRLLSDHPVSCEIELVKNVQYGGIIHRNMESEEHLELNILVDTLIITPPENINTIQLDEANLHTFKMKLRLKTQGVLCVSITAREFIIMCARLLKKFYS